MEGVPKSNKVEAENITRRSAILGGAIAAFSVKKATALTSSEYGPPLPPEDYEEVNSDSAYFKAEMHAYAERYKAELPTVLELASRVTNSDAEGRTLMRYLEEEFEAPGVPERVNFLLKKLMPALAVVESGYDEKVVSPSQAVGILQILPKVWEEHADEQMHPLSLKNQTEVAGKYLGQSYQHLINNCSDELEAIKANFFGGDEAKFEIDFLTPLLVDAYHSGMGTAVDLVKWFKKSYQKPEDTLEEIGQSEILTGKDVFYMLSKNANNQDVNKHYGDKSDDYTLKVYGAWVMLQNNLSDEQKEILLAKN